MNQFTFYANKPSQNYNKIDIWLLRSVLLLWGTFPDDMKGRLLMTPKSLPLRRQEVGVPTKGGVWKGVRVLSTSPLPMRHLSPQAAELPR